jgi:uncharacterized membrane protein (UPF0127 family)
LALLWNSPAVNLFKKAFGSLEAKMKKLALLCGLLISLSTFAQQKEKAPIFQHKKMKIAGQTLDVEVADNDEKWAYGLMFRTNLKEGCGMIFVFPEERTRSFWMKNTFVPLAIGYFNKKKQLIDVQEMAAAQSEMQTEFPNYVSKEPAQYALEVPKDWFHKHKIPMKTRFVLE